MQVEIISKGELQRFITGELFKNLSVIPITTLRAKYIINNPLIDKEDPIIVLIRDGNLTLSFSVFLPDRTSQGEKFAWNSGWWVNSEKGKKMALHSLLKGIDLWHEKVAFADLPEHTSIILEKLGHFNFSPQKDGLKIILRPYLKQSLLNKPIFKIINNLINPFPFILKKNNSIIIKKINLDQIDNESFIDLPNIGFTKRTIEDFKLIGENSWVTSETFSYTDEIAKYPFSLYTDNFKCGFYKLEKDDQQIALVYLKIRNNHLSIPYLWGAQDDLLQIMRCIVNYSIQSKANTLTVFRSDLKQILINIIPSYCPRKIIFSRTSFGTGIHFNPNKPVFLQDGEGDCIFT